MNPKNQSPPTQIAIREMFDNLAPRYDTFNHLTSMGLDSIWRRKALKPIRKGMRVLDLGCGTGDLAFGAARLVGSQGSVTGLDFSEKMLQVAERRQKEGKLGTPVRFTLGKAEDLPFESKPYDAVVSGFVLRNLYQNIRTVLAGVYRSLRPGGFISFLDITEPPGIVRPFLWRLYMTTAAAFYGKILFGRKYPIRYLPESAKRFFNAAEFIEELKKAGFKDARVRSFMFGVIGLYSGVK